MADRRVGMRVHKIKRRLCAVILTLLIVTGVIVAAGFVQKEKTDNTVFADFGQKKETIVLWYTDDALTDYLNSKALEFYDRTDIRVETKLVSGLEYLEAINRASISESEAPDLYIVSNDSLEKAYLSGLATELTETALVSQEEGFGQAAVNAVTYQGKIVGCPFYFETSALLYNKTYLEQIAQTANESMAESAEEGSEAERNTQITSEALIPATIADILNFADQYSTPENVEYFFRWDVSDIFYNYFFIGNDITVGGAAGDDKSHIDIYNTESIASLKVYQELNQFFSIDTKETTYDTIMQEFLEGKTIYTIATSDCIKRLNEATKNGAFPFEYGIAQLPAINQELTTRGMSVTNALVVNGYSRHKEAANKLIAYLAKEASGDFYEMTGKISAAEQQNYTEEHIQAFVRNYAESVPIPKMVETSNFWVELEICFAKVWGGADANTQIRTLAEKIETQLAGVPVSKEELEDPQVELLPAVEYEDNGELPEES